MSKYRVKINMKMEQLHRCEERTSPALTVTVRNVQQVWELVTGGRRRVVTVEVHLAEVNGSIYSSLPV